MNKKKGIIIGAFALVMTMVVGYALFGKSIEIKGTATASGNFDLEYECVAITDADENPTDLGTCEIVNNKIITTGTLNKPTDGIVYTIKITNNGTIPAKLKTIDSPNNATEYDINIAGDEVYFDKTALLYAAYEIKIDDENVLTGGDSAVETAELIIQPETSILLNIGHLWIDSAKLGMEQPKLPEGGVTLNYDITLGFEQITN